jgi:hypothetical protein
MPRLGDVAYRRGRRRSYDAAGQEGTVCRVGALLPRCVDLGEHIGYRKGARCCWQGLATLLMRAIFLCIDCSGVMDTADSRMGGP